MSRSSPLAVTGWGAVLYALAAVVAWLGEPKPIALIAAGAAAATATFDVCRHR